MLSFRKKLLISDFVLFLVFIALLFPFVERTVGNIMRNSLEGRADHLIAKLKDSSHLPDMIEIMKREHEFSFQRVSLLDLNGKIIYDTLLPDILGTSEAERAIGPEIKEAIQSGRGYSETYSNVFHETFAFVAVLFDSHGKKYILRTGFPFNEIHDLTIDFEIGFLLLGAFILMLYSIMTWVIMHRLTRPIQQIIDAILPYQEGREEFLPQIVLNRAMQGDEFSKLAFTLNSLTERIQKQIENLVQQRKESESILESLVEGIIATDTSAVVTFANPAACQMLGVSHDELVGQSLSQIQAHAADLCKRCHTLILHALQTAERIVQTFILRDGTSIYLDLISAPLANLSGALLVLQDKTSDYKIVEMGKDFIANASHELRTPITIIRGFAETLQDLPKLSKEMLHEITEKIVRTCGRLDKLVRSLLTLTDIENITEKNFRKTDLVLLAENCKHLLLTAYPDVTLALKSDAEQAFVLADSDLLDLAIMNLLENAVKYSQPPAQIQLEIKKGEQEVELIVTDQGIGISQSDLPYIFDRFYTADKARSRKSGGAGLGLSIVKTIVEKHNGRVLVTSEFGKGSSFIIILPLKKLASA